MRIASGISNPTYGISIPPPIIMAGMLTGGAIIPRMPPIAMMQAVSSIGTPMRIRTGDMIEPAVRTAAVEEPVIMPGNMITSIIRQRSSAGILWNFSIIRAESASSAPLSWITFIKIIAVAMTRMVST